MKGRSNIIVNISVLTLLLGSCQAQSLMDPKLPEDYEEKIYSAIKPITDMAAAYKTHSGTVERGVPVIHEELDCEKHTEDVQCKDAEMADSPMIGAGHHVRAKTNTPIIGILMQPIPSSKNGDSPLWEKEFKKHQQEEYLKVLKLLPHSKLEDVFEKHMFIEQSHVKFLEAAGARVVPIDYTMTEQQIGDQLKQLNGLYIPGDQKSLVSHGNFQYTRTIQKLLKWAQVHNEDEANHFPILGVGYGMQALVKSQIRDDHLMEEFRAQGSLQLNLAHEPKHTYIFDEYNKKDLENTLDKIKLFSDCEVGMSMKEFVLEHKTLSSIFVPVSSFDDSKQPDQNQEIVAIVEGIVYPWFGVGYRVDKIQFSMESTKRDHVDHSREAIAHAQKLANLFVDEARLSENEFDFVSDEVNAINSIQNNDAHLVEVPLVQSQKQTIRTELYLF